MKENKELAVTINRPAYGSIPVAAALDHDWTGYHLSEKMDGVWHELAIGKSIVVGELMPDASFYAFDLPIYNGTDLRSELYWARHEILDTFNLRRPATPAPGESPAHFLQRVLARGGEGIVAKLQAGPFGYDICKVKRSETFDCVVLHKTTGSMALALHGEPAGLCPLLGKSFDLVQPGDLVEIEAFCRLPSGKFREPRFKRLRSDKSALAC